MTAFDKIRKDRETGTLGDWDCHLGRDDIKCDCPYILAEYGGMGSIADISVCKSLEMPWGDDNGPDLEQARSNARRIARVPQLEAIALAAEDVAIWLQGALECKDFKWDADQREYAETALKAFQEASK